MINLYWKRCGDDGHWCDLKNLNLASLKDDGVYIIWHDGKPGRVVRIGQGQIAHRLNEHRDNPEILRYSKHGTLRVTWAVVPDHQKDGVERYLADQWSPLVGDAFPDAVQIAVNSPW